MKMQILDEEFFDKNWPDNKTAQICDSVREPVQSGFVYICSTSSTCTWVATVPITVLQLPDEQKMHQQSP